MAVNATSKREYWWIKNVSTKILSIGDLPLIPTLNPGQRADLLRFYSRDVIAQSKHLPSMVRAGWLTLTKINNDETDSVSSDDIDAATSPAEQDESGGTLEGDVENTPGTLVLRDDEGAIEVGELRVITISAVASPLVISGHCAIGPDISTDVMFIGTSLHVGGSGSPYYFNVNDTGHITNGYGGALNFDSPVNVNGEVVVNDDLSVTGATQLQGTLQILGPTTFPAGTAAAGHAPIKMTSGTNLTTPEAGALEYSSGRFTLTDTDAARRHIVQAVASTKTTAGAPYTNDGYVTLVINGVAIKVMTTA